MKMLRVGKCLSKVNARGKSTKKEKTIMNYEHVFWYL
jgi:hypothetical protein